MTYEGSPRSGDYEYPPWSERYFLDLPNRRATEPMSGWILPFRQLGRGHIVGFGDQINRTQLSSADRTFCETTRMGKTRRMRRRRV